MNLPFTRMVSDSRFVSTKLFNRFRRFDASNGALKVQLISDTFALVNANF